MLKHPFDFVGNETDDLHCFQASLRMAWQGLYGEALALGQAERLSGYVPGRQSWPFRGMLALAERGAKVVSIEDFDPVRFCEDPRAEIERQFAGDPTVVEHILSVADAYAEVAVVRALLTHRNVHFDQRPAVLADLLSAVRENSTAAICNVNYKALAGTDGYNGHFVLVTAADATSFTIQNPGLPAIENQRVSHEAFERAWSYPDANAANLIRITTR